MMHVSFNLLKWLILKVKYNYNQNVRTENVWKDGSISIDKQKTLKKPKKKTEQTNESQTQQTHNLEMVYDNNDLICTVDRSCFKDFIRP